MFSFFNKLIGKEELNYPELIKRGALIIDVRSPSEFAQGHTDGAINIPLGQIMDSADKFKKQGVPIVTCCRSGARSGSAAASLKSAGIEVYNGGSWGQVQKAIERV